MKGQSLIELLIAMGLMVILFPALLTGLLSSREGKATQKQRTQAVALLKEAAEALRSIREAGWNSFVVNGTFHPEISGSRWSLVSGSEVVDNFSRQIVISDVYRDNNYQIVQTAGILDPSTKKAIITVSWSTPFAVSVESTAYFTRYIGNTTFIETTDIQFNTGSKSAVVVTNNNGGEVVLGAGGGGNWCAPNLSIAALDLPKNGVANAITAIEGQAFAGTGDNASGDSFSNITISNTDPPIATIAGKFSGYKTNGLFGEANYAYIATDTNSKEIAILSIASTPYTEVGYFDAPGVNDATSVFVLGNVGYMLQGNMLRNFDLTSKFDSRPAIDPDGVELSGLATKVMVIGNYAYVSTASTTKELEIIDVSNPSNLLRVGFADVDGLAAQDVFTNPTATRAYLATQASPTQKEFFIIDISTKTGSRPILGSYESNGMSAKGVRVLPGNYAILVGTGAEEYQVINIANELSPVRCGGLQIDSGVNGVASVLELDGDAYSYIITGDAGAELKIIEGGPGGQFLTTGIFESATFDAGSSVAFNKFLVNGNIPFQTSLEYQVASADVNPVTGNCVGISFSFIGTDGTVNTKFATSSSIPLSDDGVGYENPARCFRYKTFLSTQDIFSSPVFYDITVSYSP